MAETNDQQAHYRSIRPEPNSLRMLNGDRFGGRFYFEENQQYSIPDDKWNGNFSDDGNVTNSSDFVELLQWYVNDHYNHQISRILNLERYAAADNDIHYWHSDKKKRADNRIASGLARYITNIRVGYQFGNPIKFGYSNKDNADDDGSDLLQQIEDFNGRVDEPYHEKIMGKNAFNTGRAYELLYIQAGTNLPKVTAIDPSTCFIIYNTDVEPKELCAIRYYSVNVKGVNNYQIEVYTDKQIFYYTAGQDPASDWQLNDTQQHYFQNVPITEFIPNEERMGIWESELDKIDAYDKSLSEMANSQEDFSNAMLTISGDITNPEQEVPLFDNYGHIVYKDNDTGDYTSESISKSGAKNDQVTVKQGVTLNHKFMQLKPSVIPNGNGGNTVVPTTAQYLTKQLDASEWQIYINRLLADIHKDTNTPDTSDENFASNASGVAMSYKLWGADQERTISETLYKRGLMRRFRLLATYWNYINGTNISFNNDDDNPANNLTITFTPNLPKNDAETMQNINSLVQAGKTSDQTIREMEASVTGIPVDQEENRIDEQNGKEDDRMANQMQKLSDNSKNGSSDDSDSVDDADE